MVYLTEKRVPQKYKIFSIIINNTMLHYSLWNSLYKKYKSRSYSSNSVVVPTSSVISINATRIICKVIILYPLHNTINQYIVIKTHRLALPITANDVIVPLYPQSGDMVMFMETVMIFGLPIYCQ